MLPRLALIYTCGLIIYTLCFIIQSSSRDFGLPPTLSMATKDLITDPKGIYSAHARNVAYISFALGHLVDLHEVLSRQMCQPCECIQWGTYPSIPSTARIFSESASFQTHRWKEWAPICAKHQKRGEETVFALERTSTNA